ncbi:MAG: M48 family metallopeptidase, partial [Candidatus Micrarchaeota archaeon]|nr:M48 family metallopeptidase [Candidatus Micrarchaeota archaeon]
MESDIKIEKIIRTKRKTMALQITDENTLIVKAPFHIENERIIEIVEKHRRWIQKRKNEIAKRKSKLFPKEFVGGEGFFYLGKYYKLKIVDNQDTPL